MQQQDWRDQNLPIQEIVPKVLQELRAQNRLIVHAPPGAGKSTLLPLTLLDQQWLGTQKILMLEPRRLAAKGIANRMADLLGEPVGKTVGYRIRFENKISAATRIEVITEGILGRMLLSDNSLEGIGLIIFDEFHERSLHADLALALSIEAQQVLRQDMRILIMSATLDAHKLSTILKAPVAESLGRQYPVSINYATGQQDLSLLPELAAQTIKRAVNEHQGDALVFLPGEGEIRKCEELLRKSLRGFAICPLYGQLPYGKQREAILPHPKGKRKVVLATSIAETSLTIQGITIVVDSGLSRISRFDPGTGLSGLQTVELSKDAADQRAGRAGRLSPGVCYRMWTKADQERLKAHRTPEIDEADLAPLMLNLAEWGIKNIEELTWISHPPKGAVSQAKTTLTELEALDADQITPHGKALNKLPCHPRIGHLMLMAQEEGLLALATDVAAILEERDPMPKDSGIDINLRIETLRRQRREQNLSRAFGRLEKVAASYRKLFNIDADNDSVNPFDTGVLLVYAYPERIACSRPGNNAQFQLANGSYAMAGHKDDLGHEQWLAVAHLNAGRGTGRIHLASPLNPKDLAPMVKELEKVTWDSRSGGLVASNDLCIGSIVLQSKPLQQPNPDKVAQAILEAIRKEGQKLLDFDEETTQWQNRVLSLRKWRKNENWPDVSTDGLLTNCHQWLAPYLTKVRKNEDLKKIQLPQVLQAWLPWEQQTALDRFAPTRLEVPSGSRIKIQYHANGESPILAVRIQEVFGLAQTPCVNDGRTPTLLHLLSPAQRPMQVTKDLKSFWETAYFEVRKDLKSRYPKHHWPNNPWTAEALKGVKRNTPKKD